MTATVRYRPCDNCPFREDVVGFLAPQRVYDIADSLLRRDMVFPCHKTVDYEQIDDDEDIHPLTGQELLCAGSLRLLEANDPFRNRAYRMAVMLGLYQPDRLDRETPCFESVEAMAEHMRRSPLNDRTR